MLLVLSHSSFHEPPRSCTKLWHLHTRLVKDCENVSRSDCERTSSQSQDPEPQAGSVAVSNLIQHYGSLFLPVTMSTPRVHFCTPLITIPYAPLRSKGFGCKAVCAYIGFSNTVIQTQLCSPLIYRQRWYLPIRKPRQAPHTEFLEHKHPLHSVSQEEPTLTAGTNTLKKQATVDN